MPNSKDPTEFQFKFIKLLTRAYLDDCLSVHNVDFMEKFKSLLQKLDVLFLAKVAIYIRHNYNIKGIPNYIGAYISERISGKRWGKYFYRELVLHIDDMVEMVNILNREGKKIPMNMKNGFAQAFEKFDTAQILKYKNRKEGMNLQDIIRLVHPKASRTNAIGMDFVMNNAMQLDNIADLGDDEMFRIIQEIEFS